MMTNTLQAHWVATDLLPCGHDPAQLTAAGVCRDCKIEALEAGLAAAVTKVRMLLERINVWQNRDERASGQNAANAKEMQTLLREERQEPQKEDGNG